jgi:hypothetical protein
VGPASHTSTADACTVAPRMRSHISAQARRRRISRVGCPARLVRSRATAVALSGQTADRPHVTRAAVSRQPPHPSHLPLSAPLPPPPPPGALHLGAAQHGSTLLGRIRSRRLGVGVCQRRALLGSRRAAGRCRLPRDAARARGYALVSGQSCTPPWTEACGRATALRRLRRCGLSASAAVSPAWAAPLAPHVAVC